MLYFYSEIKLKHNNQPQIHCFELVNSNIDFINKNININNIPLNEVTIAKYALSNEDDQSFYFEENSNSIHLTSKKTNNVIKSKTIDTYVKENNLSKLDFIKMDIEGAERFALEGAKATIKAFKPKLAICIYHLWDDPFIIPEIILSANKNYNFYFKWAVPIEHSWGEGILFAKPVENTNKLTFNPSSKLTEQEIYNALITMLNSSATVFKDLVKAKLEIFNYNKTKWHKKLLNLLKKKKLKLP